MQQKIEIGFQAFILGSSEEFGAVRDVSPDGKQLTVYVENAGFVKLREITLGYELPTVLTSNLLNGLVQTARLEISGVVVGIMAVGGTQIRGGIGQYGCRCTRSRPNNDTNRLSA